MKYCICTSPSFQVNLIIIVIYAIRSHVFFNTRDPILLFSVFLVLPIYQENSRGFCF